MTIVPSFPATVRPTRVKNTGPVEGLVICLPVRRPWSRGPLSSGAHHLRAQVFFNMKVRYNEFKEKRK